MSNIINLTDYMISENEKEIEKSLCESLEKKQIKMSAERNTARMPRYNH